VESLFIIPQPGRCVKFCYMEITILLFGTLKDAAGTDRIAVAIPDSTSVSVAALLEECGQQYPQIARWLPHVRVAVNLEYAGTQGLVAEGDEVALIPPVAGGALALTQHFGCGERVR
jgi:molybdopterin synthase catalytic subunit